MKPIYSNIFTKHTWSYYLWSTVIGYYWWKVDRSTTQSKLYDTLTTLQKSGVLGILYGAVRALSNVLNNK